MLDEERKKASFNKRDLSLVIYGGKAGLQNYLRLQSIVDNDPVLKFDPSFLHQSRHQMMETMAKKMLRLHSYHKDFPLNQSTQIMRVHLLNYQSPLSIHLLMFLTTLDNLCDDEQRKLFYDAALRGEMLGCYAQTQLGHGTDVQQLQTTATYNASNETFTINSPSISSTKWWIGDLGVHCNHAALFAKLIINNKSYGTHAFLVPIRDPVTYQPLSGIEVGDIGPKHGFTTKDNGYAIFNNVVIPRRYMLMKYHIVSKEGTYSLQGDQKISYATMLVTRSNITQIATNKFSKVTTIATRYSLLRRQFKSSSDKEIAVLDYQTQQAKVISRIGETYAYLFTNKNIKELANFVFTEAKQNRFDRLNEAHILTSAAKAYLTGEGLNNMQIARRSAGGHGFHLYSGIIGTMQQFGTAYTLEGQFSILMLQVARFLLKSLSNLRKGKKLSPSVKYLQELAKGELVIDFKEEHLSCPYFVHKMLRYYSCISTKNMGLKLAQGMKEGLSQKDAWDTYAGLTISNAAIAHTQFTIHGYFLSEIKKISQLNLKNVMTKLCILNGLQKIIERANWVYQTKILNPEAFKLINKKRQALLLELRPEALTLMEAFEYSDNTLQSAIAHSNEKPYQNLIDWARRYNTINRPEERNQIIEAIKHAKLQLRSKL